MNWTNSLNQLDSLATETQLEDNRQNYREFHPWDYQIEALNKTKVFTEIGCFWANQIGKTRMVGFLVRLHALRDYSKFSWYDGKRFNEPTRIVCVGRTPDQLRRGIQRYLLGVEGNPGSGFLPMAKDNGGIGIIDIKWKKDWPKTADLIIVRDSTGQTSVISQVATTQDLTTILGDTAHLIVVDEDPQEDQLLGIITSRIINTRGNIVYTMTPEFGYTSIVTRIMEEEPEGSWYRNVSLYEAPHLLPPYQPAGYIEQIIKRYPPHERLFRVQGIPIRGHGLIYQYSEDDIGMFSRDMVLDPCHHIVGLDLAFSYTNTAAVWVSRDTKRDRVYVWDCDKRKNVRPDQFVHILRRNDYSLGFQPPGGVPVSWPKDANQSQRSFGNRVADDYRNVGANMLPHPARWRTIDGKYTHEIEAGINEIVSLMDAGKFFIAKDPHMKPLWDELRKYVREQPPNSTKPPQPTHKNCDLLDALRYGVGMLMQGYGAQSPHVAFNTTASQFTFTKKRAGGI